MIRVTISLFKSDKVERFTQEFNSNTDALKFVADSLIDENIRGLHITKIC
jgi:hypothetical protein